MAEELFNYVLEEDSVKPDKHAQLNREYIMKEVNYFKNKYQDYVANTKSSFMMKKMPYRELPDIEEGNYSMCLYNREAVDVNEWVKQDLRTEKIAMQEIKEDIKKFAEYDTFNVSYVNPIKYRNEVNFVVDHKYVPIGVQMSTEVPNEVKYPDLKSLVSDFRRFAEGQEEHLQRGLEDHFKKDLDRTEQILRDGFSMLQESDKQKIKNAIRKKMKSLDKMMERQSEYDRSKAGSVNLMKMTMSTSSQPHTSAKSHRSRSRATSDKRRSVDIDIPKRPLTLREPDFASPALRTESSLQEPSSIKKSKFSVATTTPIEASIVEEQLD